MKKEFRWLHLSDIHYQSEDESFNDTQIRNSLPEFLKKNNIECDVIIITGDFRYAPRKEAASNEEVIKYITNISSKIYIEDSKIIIVPGNHDLNRSCYRDYLIKGIKNDYKPENGKIDKKVLSSLSEDFVFYNSIQKKYKLGLKTSDINPHKIIDVGSCYFLLLNTSIVAGTDKDSNCLIVGCKYLSDILDNQTDNKPIIAVGHHGFDMLKLEEKHVLTKYLEKKGVRLYLCGHTHDNWLSSFAEKGKQINVGCMSMDEGEVKVGFSLGKLTEGGTVKIDMYMWDKKTSSWNKDEGNCATYKNLYKIKKKESPTGDSLKKKEVPTSESHLHPKLYDFPLKLYGYQLIGGFGCDGIKYVWKKNTDICIESLAFNRRVRLQPNVEDNNTSAYTISTSMGCQLSAFGMQCIFCQTGANSYVPLTAEEIALQCIYMAEYDSDCKSYPNVRTNKREFAFMGQGEPGFNYTQIKRAILLTDAAMKEIKQSVSRYIISTSGINDFMPELIRDLKNKVYSNRVTIHFSLNAVGEDRSKIMPINNMYDYKDFIKSCHYLYDETKEKIGVGILLMVDYQTKKGDYLSIDAGKIKAILNELDSTIFKIDFCTVNKTDMGSQPQLSNEAAMRYLSIAKELGFECKLFASFGDGENAGCGMLKSSLDEVDISEEQSESMIHYHNAVKLLMDAKETLIAL